MTRWVRFKLRSHIFLTEDIPEFLGEVVTGAVIATKWLFHKALGVLAWVWKQTKRLYFWASGGLCSVWSAAKNYVKERMF